MTGSDYLRSARKELKLTQTEMGYMFGYRGNTKQMIYEIESGRRTLPNWQRRLLDAYLSGYRPDDWPN